MIKMHLSIFIGFLFLTLFNNCSSCSTREHRNEKKVFGNLKELIKESFEVEDRLDADFNQDGRNDEILVIRYNESNRRSLLICFKENDDEFKLDVVSFIAIANKESGNNNDPYLGIKSEKGCFSLRHRISKRVSDSIEHIFSFEPNSKIFYLTKIEEYTNGQKYTRTAQDFGEVNIFDFNINKEY